jgi:hypothetical protein
MVPALQIIRTKHEYDKVQGFMGLQDRDQLPPTILELLYRIIPDSSPPIEPLLNDIVAIP